MADHNYSRLTVNSGEFGIGVVKYSDGEMLLNGGYFGMIALMDPTESVMALLCAGKTYWCIQGNVWGNDSNTISEPDRKILQEVQVVDVPLSITGGAAYVDAADNTKFKNAEAAAQSTLTGVKVIRHTHSVDETTGTCACGESFGDLAPDNHDGLRRVAKVNATSAADGNIEYWYCSGCGKYYLDAAATKEITYKDTILPAIGLRIVDDVKVWGPGDKPLGVIFHKEYNSFTVQIDGVKSADTGDSFPMGGMTAALFISGGALALMSIRARRKEEEA